MLDKQSTIKMKLTIQKLTVGLSLATVANTIEVTWDDDRKFLVACQVVLASTAMNMANLGQSRSRAPQAQSPTAWQNTTLGITPGIHPEIYQIPTTVSGRHLRHGLNPFANES